MQARDERIGYILAHTCPPFRLDLTTWALRRRPNNMIDWWNGETYRRVLVMNGYPAEVAVRQCGPVESPRDGVGARNNLRSWLKVRKPLDYDGVHRLTAKWQPYAGFVYFHMLLNRLDAAGYLFRKA